MHWLRFAIVLLMVSGGTIHASEIKCSRDPSTFYSERVREDRPGAVLFMADDIWPLVDIVDQARSAICYRDMDVAKRGIPLKAGILLTGCGRDESGGCRATVSYTVLAPDGHVERASGPQPLWPAGSSPPTPSTVAGDAMLDVLIGDDDPDGVYTLRADVQDQVTGASWTLAREFTAVEAGAMQLEGLDKEARKILEGATHLELLSLDPEHDPPHRSRLFHGFRVLGRTPIGSPDDRRRLFFELNKGNAENAGMRASCFNPRHGLRAALHGRVADLVICFECRQVVAYVGDRDAGGFTTSPSPQPFLDGLLRRGGTTLAAPPEPGSAATP